MFVVLGFVFFVVCLLGFFSPDFSRVMEHHALHCAQEVGRRCSALCRRAALTEAGIARTSRRCLDSKGAAPGPPRFQHGQELAPQGQNCILPQ